MIKLGPLFCVTGLSVVLPTNLFAQSIVVAQVNPIPFNCTSEVAELKSVIVNERFDEYTNKRPRYQYHKMEEVIEQVKEGEMPLNSYTWTHTDARLTDEEKSTLTNWAQQVMDTLKLNYPIDSLIRPKKPSTPNNQK